MLEFLLFLTGQAAGRNTALVFLSGWSTAHYRPDVEDAAGRINWAQLQRISKFGALHMLLLHMAAQKSHAMINSSGKKVSGCGSHN